MKYSISTCSFYKYRIRKLLDMPEDLGVEIFYEYGSRNMWNSFLDALPGRSFSIHAPFAFVDIAEDCDEEKLFDVLRRPFDMYHKYNGEFYVLHTYGDGMYGEDEPHRAAARVRAAERLSRFNEICIAEGVTLGAENLCSGARPLFDQQQFLRLFRDIPALHCVLDVGHAIVTGMDIGVIQQTLKERICAYHLHNNDGLHDLHDRLRAGVFDWTEFAKNCALYTPGATGVLEYMNVVELDAYTQDSLYLEKLINGDLM